MELHNGVAVVTGAANGIGRAMCRRFAHEGLSGLVVSDLDLAGAAAVAAETGGIAVGCDVADEAQVRKLVEVALERFGRIDLFCANAGVTAKGGLEATDADWDCNWRVNVLSHVYAARAVVPQMVGQGGGYFLTTASAAGLLTEIGSAPYSVTKHAAVAFAEWLSVHYRRKGLIVSTLCPAGVATDFLDLDDPIHQFLHLSSLTPEAVAECVVDGIRAEKFVILPHPEVDEFFAFKGQDYDRWLHNFSRVHEKLTRRKERRE
ncbi:MAG: SDR family oxidoreductase [Planctomycetaceae bacterium]|nr:SDR family oxidoreductase [Planctomycetaceae bacterium]